MNIDPIIVPIVILFDVAFNKKGERRSVKKGCSNFGTACIFNRDICSIIDLYENRRDHGRRRAFFPSVWLR